MLRITSSLAARETIPIIKDKIKWVGDNNTVHKTSIVIKINTRTSEFQMGFFMLRSRLAFAKLRQASNIALILYYLDLQCHI